jgi:hypothetical protein
MSTYDPEYDLTQLMTDFKDCAIEAGFCPTGIKFGPPSAINFDHNICYDLLNIDYPSSYIVEGIKEVYTFELILARPVLSGSNQGVELFDDDAVQIFSELEFKLWTMLGCLALGISGGGGCRAHVPMHKVTIERFKGLHNDNLVVLAVRFDAIANIAVPPEPCGGSTGGPPGCEDPCAPFFGVCGCTDPDATNYNPSATFDDGTCCYVDASCVEDPGDVLGCTDPASPNYNPAATVDDGSC